MLDKLILITGHRKSGTTMFSNLFDGHKDFLVYPTDLTIFYAYYPNFIEKKISYLKKKKKLIAILDKTLGKKISKLRLNKKINYQKFKKIVSDNINSRNINNIKKILNIILKSYDKSLIVKRNYKYIVVKETSLDIFINQIFNKHDKVKFIHIFRDPRDNFASLKSGSNKYYQSFGEDINTLLLSMIVRAKLDFYFMEKNQKLFTKKKYQSIKFEELVTKPRKVMANLCKFLNVKFSSSLLKPTILGAETDGNNFDKLKFNKISSKNINNYKKRLSKKYIKIIEMYFGDEIKKFMYPKNINLKIEKELNYISDFYKEINKTFFYRDRFK